MTLTLTMKNQMKNEFGKGGIVDDGYNDIQQKVINDIDIDNEESDTKRVW